MAENTCGTRVFSPIDRDTVGRIFREIRRNGGTITGENPWQVVSSRHGVTLHGEWEPATLTLRVTILQKPLLASCDRVWRHLTKLVQQIQRSHPL